MGSPLGGNPFAGGAKSKGGSQHPGKWVPPSKMSILRKMRNSIFWDFSRLFRKFQIFKFFEIFRFFEIVSKISDFQVFWDFHILRFSDFRIFRCSDFPLPEQGCTTGWRSPGVKIHLNPSKSAYQSSPISLKIAFQRDFDPPNEPKSIKIYILKLTQPGKNRSLRAD